MKAFYLTALCALSLAAWGQPVFENSGKSLSDVCHAPEGKTPVSVQGDINKDGIKDLVIAIPEVYDGDTFAFYLGQKDGSLSRFRSYEVLLPYGDNTHLSITDAGVVRIQLDRDEGADIFLFRFEKGDFRLIGGKKDRHKSSENYDISYNYLTNKMIRTDGSGGSRKVTNGDLPKLPVINFGWIPLSYDMLDYLHAEPEDGPMTPDDILVMGIFRVMQANEMLFWHFCDWDNPYRDPRPADEDSWYAEDDYMSPGSYNYYATLDINKRQDGAYWIEMSESFTDRSFEADIDWESDEEIELPEGAYEEETSEGGWIFRDGQFIPQEVTQTASPAERSED